MNNLVSRILLVSAALPALFSLIWFLPQGGHAAAVILAAFVTAGCGAEISRLFSARGIRSNTTLFSFLAAFPMTALWILVHALPESAEAALFHFVAVISLAALAILTPFAFPRNSKEIEDTLVAASARAFPLLYPGFFSAFIVLIADYPGASTPAMLWFLLIVFGNDSLAWAVGMLFGRHRGLLPVSPNKSLEGFAGAYAGSLAGAFLGPVLFPSSVLGSPLRLSALGLLVGTAVIAGDLFESSLKRSAGVKDSGASVPGRGGFLDSFDSILFAAPVFFIVVRLLNLI